MFARGLVDTISSEHSYYFSTHLKKEKTEEEVALIREIFTELYCAVRELQKYSEFE